MGEMNTPITGGCLCGAVRYEASAQPKDSVYCHCSMCQRWNGAPATAAVAFSFADLRITKGEPKFYRSSPNVERGFCTDCGSSVFVRYPKVDQFWVSTGTLDDAVNAPPLRHMGIESKLPWFDIADDLPRTRSDEEIGTPGYEVAARQIED